MISPESKASFILIILYFIVVIFCKQNLISQRKITFLADHTTVAYITRVQLSVIMISSLRFENLNAYDV